MRFVAVRWCLLPEVLCVMAVILLGLLIEHESSAQTTRPTKRFGVERGKEKTLLLPSSREQEPSSLPKKGGGSSLLFKGRPTSKSTTGPASSQRIFSRKGSKSKRNASSCSTGCAAVKPLPSTLHSTQLVALLRSFAKEPMSSESRSLETILFHGKKARSLWSQQPRGILGKQRRQFLERELQRTHAWVSLRIVDVNGVVRAFLKPKRVPIGEHFHLHTDATTDLQPLSFGGRTKRVGLYHIWIRI